MSNLRYKDRKFDTLKNYRLIDRHLDRYRQRKIDVD